MVSAQAVFSGALRYVSIANTGDGTGGESIYGGMFEG